MLATEKRSGLEASTERTTEPRTSGKLVGTSVLRVEDRRLITGRDQYIDNLKFPDMVYAGFVRSPYAYARIKRIDVSSLLENPEVVAILSPEEVRATSNPIPVLWRVAHSNVHEHYALAQGKVKHVGDPLLAVAVKHRYALEDVLESVVVEYEVLEPVLDPWKAEEKKPIHESLQGNLCYEVPISAGNVEEAFKSPEAIIVSGTFKVSRLTASPMETRGVIADTHGTRSALTIYSSTQWPHELRTLLANCLKVQESDLRVISPDVGGGFGVKGEVCAEEIVVPLLSLKCGFPVKWIESRSEHFLATTHGRDQMLKAAASFLADGTLTGLKVEYVCDFGAYLHTITMGSGFITAISLGGPYHVPNLSVIAKGVYTNKVSISAYRGFGQPEAAFVTERLMSIAAAKLGIDASEIRFKNLVQPSEMPYKNATGGVLDSGDYPACLRKALDLAEYDKMIARRDQARKQGRLYGVGISFFTETSGFAPGFVFAHLGLSMGGFDSASMKITPDGKLLASTGALPHGQGFNTSLTQICADELGLSIRDIKAFHGDTDSSPYGQGSFGSRTVAVAGSAAVLACRKLAEKVKLVGAHLLKLEDASELKLQNGFVVSRLKPEVKVSITDVAKAAYLAFDLPAGLEPGLEATVYFNPIGLATSYSAIISEVEVDRDTGGIKIVNQIDVHDCGNQINPMIVKGQVQGSLAQAIGACLLEEVVYDEQGQIVNPSFLDYLLPTAQTIPTLTLGSLSIPTPINPLGSKGIGESGTIIAPPSIANAVSDAINSDMNTLPMTPERVWKAIHQEGHHLLSP